MIGFCRYLRAHGFKVSQGHVRDALEAIHLIGLEREQVKECLRCTLCSNQDEWRLFDRLFEQYFRNSNAPHGPAQVHKIMSKAESIGEGKHLHTYHTIDRVDGMEELTNLGLDAGSGYSPISQVMTKKIENFSPDEVQLASLAIRHMIAPFKISKSRRTRRARKGARLDIREIVRDAIRHFGWPFSLYFLKKKKRLKRLVIIADVSGSMTRHASIVIPFLLGLRSISLKAEVFVFSTQVTRVTHTIKHLPLDKIITRLVEETPNWSGGTRIGESLQMINRDYGGKCLNHRTVVIILSDGWDLGPKRLLEREMKRLHGMVKKVIWLNPIAGDPQLAIMSMAVAISMPYIHHHIPAGSLEDLRKAARILYKAAME